jgi:hypothetical protein
VGYFRARFHISRPEADALFHAASQSVNRRNDLIRDGYADGLDALKGGCRARRLLNYFSQRSARAADTSADIPELAAAAG